MATASQTIPCPVHKQAQEIPSARLFEGPGDVRKTYAEADHEVAALVAALTAKGLETGELPPEVVEDHLTLLR